MALLTQQDGQQTPGRFQLWIPANASRQSSSPRTAPYVLEPWDASSPLAHWDATHGAKDTNHHGCKDSNSSGTGWQGQHQPPHQFCGSPELNQCQKIPD